MDSNDYRNRTRNEFLAERCPRAAKRQQDRIAESDVEEQRGGQQKEDQRGCLHPRLLRSTGS